MATYTSTASGLWSAGATWVGGVKPPSGAGHKIIIAAGHTVTYDEAAGEYGDDTSSTTAANNGIVVYGTLKASRSVSTQLTCRGTLMRATGGTVDWGSSSDRIPSGVTSNLVLNYSTSLSNGKHGMTSHGATSGTWNLGGKARTRNTTLTASATAGSNVSITVADATGWEVGDQVVLESDNITVSRANLTTLTAVSGNNVTLAALNYDRASGCYIGNLSSNVAIKAYSSSFAAPCAFAASSSGGMTCDISHVRFENIGSTVGWSGGGQNVPMYFGAGVAAGASSTQIVLSDCVGYSDTSTHLVSASTDGLSVHPVRFDRWAIYTPAAARGGIYFGNGSSGRAVDCFIYRCKQPHNTGYAAGCLDGLVTGGIAHGENYFVMAESGALKFTGTKARSQQWFIQNITGTNITIENSDVDCGSRLFSQFVASSPTVLKMSGCTLSSQALTGELTTSSAPSQLQRAVMITVNGNMSDNRDYSYWRLCDTDATTRRRCTYSVRIRPKVANAAITYTFTIPAVSGVAQVIKGSLRFDSIYGTATPPSIALSGQGVTASFTAPAAADAWHDFTFSFTPTSTGDITATVTVQSASTSGFAWLDGVYHYPMTQSVRHYGYQWLPQAAQIVDTRLTLTEAAALALPIVVDHGAETITITGSATVREVFEHCVADLCQTANQGEAVHISSSTGDTFVTTYTVVGTVVGVYTDAGGTSAVLTLTGLQDASVLLVDGTGATVEFQAAQSGEFDYVYAFAPGAAGTWKWVAKAPGREHATGTFTPGTGGAFTYAPVLVPKLTPSGEPMYTGTTSALVAVSISGTTNAYIDIGNGTAPLQETFNETELALVTQAGMEWLAAGKDDVSIFDSGSGDYLFLTAGWCLRRASAGAANAAIEAYVASADGVIVDDTNGPVLYLTSNTPAAIAAAVWAYIDRELTQAIPTAAQIADTVLGRNLAGGSDGGRTVRDALRASRNKSAISGSTLTVYQEDDATPAWTAAVSTAERDALQSIDPA